MRTRYPVDRSTVRSLALTGFLALVAACIGPADNGVDVDAQPDGATQPAGVTGSMLEIPVPAATGSRTPSLFAAADGAVYLSWQEPASQEADASSTAARGRFALRFARLVGEEWSAPRTIAEGDDFFVNWADFPTIIESDGGLAAHWLRRNGGVGTAYDVHIARSLDGGETWLPPVVPHADGTPTEHGFVSLVADPGGGFTAVWLDGRKYATAASEAGREMTLRSTRFDADGAQQEVALLDPRICDCCQTSAAYARDTLVVVYRDRSPEEIRDIWSVRRTADGWQEPVPVATDGWMLPGCPVNGPAIATHGDLAVVAWFTMQAGDPQVRLAFSRDRGASFSEPIIIDRAVADGVDSGNPREVAALADASAATRPIPLGRVDVAWLGPDRAVVSWIVARGSEAEILYRGVRLDGTLEDTRMVGGTGSMRASGFPRMVRQGDRLLFAWTTPGAEISLHVGSLRLDSE